MTYLAALWLPILLSAIAVFVVSSIIHMVLGWHGGDYRQLPSEDHVMDGLREHDIPPGDYVMPWAGSTKAMGEEAFQEKLKKGPVGFMTIVDGWTMGKSLLQWFIYSLVVSAFAGIIAAQASHENPSPGEVFHFTMLVSFACYFMALAQNSIWYKRSWVTTFKYFVDGVLYALATAAVFAWLWPL